MTSAICGSSENKNQSLDTRKTVSWGDRQVTAFEPSTWIPEHFSEKASSACRLLIEGRDALLKALQAEKRKSPSLSDRSQAIASLRSAIEFIDRDCREDPAITGALQSAHVLLARAYIGVYSAAFMQEIKFIRSDPAMSRKYDEWQRLLEKRTHLFA